MTTDEIRAEIARCEELMTRAARRTSARLVLLTSRIDTLRWVLGEAEAESVPR